MNGRHRQIFLRILLEKIGGMNYYSYLCKANIDSENENNNI